VHRGAQKTASCWQKGLSGREILGASMIGNAPGTGARHRRISDTWYRGGAGGTQGLQRQKWEEEEQLNSLVELVGRVGDILAEGVIALVLGGHGCALVCPGAVRTRCSSSVLPADRHTTLSCARKSRPAAVGDVSLAAKAGEAGYRKKVNFLLDIRSQFAVSSSTS
jgi:hypothetical protein